LDPDGRLNRGVGRLGFFLIGPQIELHWEEPVEPGNPIPSDCKDFDHNVFQSQSLVQWLHQGANTQYRLTKLEKSLNWILINTRQHKLHTMKIDGVCSRQQVDF
jgi:hypothetical protein